MAYLCIGIHISAFLRNTRTASRIYFLLVPGNKPVSSHHKIDHRLCAYLHAELVNHPADDILGQFWQVLSVFRMRFHYIIEKRDQQITRLWFGGISSCDQCHIASPRSFPVFASRRSPKLLV